MSLIFQECIKTYPKRPKLRAAEWLYRKDELEDRIDYWMAMIDRIGSTPSSSNFAADRPLLHKGKKARK